MTKLVFAALAAAALAAPVAATTINFEDQSSGAKANGYTVSGVHFSDTIGANLSLGSFGASGSGQRSLAVFGDDSSRLQMDFDVVATDISLAFGNDDPCCAATGDRAWLSLLLGGVQVGSTSVAMNLNDAMDQTIGINGIAFDRAVFWYGNAGGTPTNLIEIVDNISFNAAQVPEPAMLGLFGLGAIGLGFSRRRRA